MRYFLAALLCIGSASAQTTTTKIVGAKGGTATVTGGKLDVNATVSATATTTAKATAAAPTYVEGTDSPISQTLNGGLRISGTINATSAATATAAAPSYGEGTSQPLSQTLGGSQRVTGAGGTFPVTGTFWQATQPVSLASMPSTPVTGTFWQATQPVSGTVTATGPITDTQLRASAVPVSLASVPSHAVTGTFWPAASDPGNYASASSGLSTATTLGQIVALSGTNRTFIKNWKCSASAAATTTTDQQCTLKYGTGSNCATGTTYLDGCFNPATGGCNGGELAVPAGQAVCWVHAVAGSKIVTLTYYQAP